ncbi:VOC family protein [Sphingobacterium prati]|uniref:VOC family protein n=1 Tax=Sphingobacterium prati TaxID=2737006 RepID=UPI0015581479|nr:glyoxalase [Sphingobacterium prati]NPE47380.1 glyoxalase [Sphingobacterium prati]
MNKGIKTVLYPVQEMAQSKALFAKLLNVEPYVYGSCYIGFKVNHQDSGLVPNNPENGLTAFFHVDNIKSSLQILIDSGCEIIRDITDVGGGRLVASAKGSSNNMIRLVQI